MQFLKNRPLLKIAFIHLVAKKRQTLVATLGVMFGITVFIFQAGLITGFQTTFKEKTINTSANIRIYNEAEKNRKGIIEKINTNENHWNIVRNQKPKDEDPKLKNGMQIIRIIEQNPEVAGVSPYVGSPGIFKLGLAEVSGRVSGVDIEKENLVFKVSDNMVEGGISKLQTIPNGIILGIGLAEKMGAKLNDNISLISPLGVALEMRVVGIHQSGLTEMDNTRAYINIRNAQRLLKVDGSYLTNINIKLKNIDKAEELAIEMEKKFGYKAEDWKQANANIFGLFKIQNMITILVIVSILIVSGFGIYNILTTIIYEKLPDIAILKSIGFKDREIQKIFLAESLVIGLTGGILGMILGFIVTRIIGNIPMNVKGFVSMKYLYFNSHPLFYVFAFFFAIIVTALAGYFPARKASKVDPIDIIRGK